ncbi:hypothetical protein [Sulfuriroseicoccus oceanibius]|uniref:Uncharacterized protein n=1 Tax=Sulfuriroseicoccus oceanibius TaxID=2707525 RepID=A0A7T7JBA1_9BACT|nr:hypothetical protein [Sulfuriroseicoccus oceanibius]QQL43839.1 hypothetical protein G3M56_008000 [Sulfuriroseicoccus oceanibius]
MPSENHIQQARFETNHPHLPGRCRLVLFGVRLIRLSGVFVVGFVGVAVVIAMCVTVSVVAMTAMVVQHLGVFPGVTFTRCANQRKGSK